MTTGRKNPARIVLIEDNLADVHLLRYALDASGEPYQLEVLADGEEALRFVRNDCAQGHAAPCLIVLDLHLPRYDGLAVLRAIRREPALAPVHVAVLTTTPSPRQKAELHQIGVDLYRQKPSELAEIFALAGELLALCQGQARPALVGAG